MSLSTVSAYKFSLGIANGLLLADEAALHEINDAMQLAERSGDSFALALVTSTLGIALIHADRASVTTGYGYWHACASILCSGDSR